MAKSKWWQFWKIHHFLQNIARYIAASLKDKIANENLKSQFCQITVQNNTSCKMVLPDYAKLLIAHVWRLTKTIICHQLLHLMECIFRQHFQTNFLHCPSQLECALLFQIRMILTSVFFCHSNDVFLLWGYLCPFYLDRGEEVEHVCPKNYLGWTS